MNLTLCYAPIACSLVPLINLNEAGGSFEVRKINLRKGDNMTSDYLVMNPLHKCLYRLSTDAR
jgi:glutathione S-transferase